GRRSQSAHHREHRVRPVGQSEVIVPRSDILRMRLCNQHIAQQTYHDAADIVRHLGAVQAQDYAGAKWALGMRLLDATDLSIEQAFADGAILRTHVMRATWHFVARDDLRWLPALTAPRVNAASA